MKTSDFRETSKTAILEEIQKETEQRQKLRKQQRR